MPVSIARLGYGLPHADRALLTLTSIASFRLLTLTSRDVRVSTFDVWVLTIGVVAAIT